MLQSMGSQRVRHHLATEQKQHDHMQWCSIISHKKKTGENLLLVFGNSLEPLGEKQKFQFILRLMRNNIIILRVEI